MSLKVTRTARQLGMAIVEHAGDSTFTKADLILLISALLTVICLRLRGNSHPKSVRLCVRLLNVVQNSTFDSYSKEITGSPAPTSGSTVTLPELLAATPQLVRRCLEHGTVDCMDCFNKAQTTMRRVPYRQRFEWVEVQNGHE